MRRSLMVASALAALVVSGCSAVSSDSGGSDGGDGESHLRVAMAKVPYGPSLDPLLTTYLDPQVTNIFEALTTVDQEGKLVPQLATEWQNIDPHTWEFTLRPDVQFSNGDPVTAEDVKFSYDRIMDPANNSNETHFHGIIESAEVVDDLTIRFNTQQEVATLPATIAMLKIVPKKYLEEVGNEEFAKKPIGTGPYVFVSWTTGTSIVEEANPLYWGGEPEIKTITYLDVPSPSTRKAMLLDGSVDLAEKLLYTDEAEIEANPDLQIIKAQIDYTDFISINTFVAPFDDVRVRQALSYAVDVDAIIERVIGGSGKRAAIQNSPLDQGYHTGLTPYPYDPDKARELLAEAGFDASNPFPAQVMDVGTDRQPYNTDVAQAIAGYLTEAGMPTTVNVMESTALFDKYLSGDAGLIYMGSRSSSGESIDRFANFYHSKGRALYWNTPEMDALVDEARTEFDDARRQELYNQIQQTIFDQATTVALYDEVVTFGASANLHWDGPTANGSIPLGEARFE